ncbi:MAG TPA: hypothetical protein GXZ90_09085 [Clostridiales bacterium]|nr:hypothetical protein [Clostridiales bacterium]
MDRMHEYHNKLEDEGYIAEDGEPLKCQHCNNKSFVEKDSYFECVGRVEYTLVCDKCNEFAGHWAYGYWQIN